MADAMKTMLYCLLLLIFCFTSASSYANNPPQGRLVASFSYNAEGLRIEKQGERGIERYTYDDQSVLSQRDGSNALVARYTYGPNRLISLEHKSEGTQFYLTDALNSIVDLMTTDGLVQARYQYDAFGNKRSESGSSWNRFAFTGYEEDKETNLLYAKARYYDADTGRFLSQDAWHGENNTPPSLHKYLYAYQNPTVYVDPSGNAPVFNETAQGLRKLADETRATADGLEDNGLNVFSAAGMGLGAGLLDIMGAGTEVVNQGVNLATDAVANKNSSSIWAQESRADLAQTRSKMTDRIESGVNTAEIIKENPSGAMNAVKDSSVAAARKFASGDTGSVSEAFSGLALVPPAVAGVKAAAEGIKLAGKGAGKAFNATKQITSDLADAFKSSSRNEKLIHLTDAAGEAGINATNNLNGSLGIFAVPSFVSTESTAIKVARTGLMPDKTTNFVNIPKNASNLFRQPVPIGPYSALKYFGGVRYAPAGSINMSTGIYSAGGSLIGPQALIYGPDALFYGGAAGGAYYYGTKE